MTKERRMRVVRVYHAGRDPAHRAREHALVRAGVELRLIVPDAWPGPDNIESAGHDIVSLPVRRPGDVNRHVYADTKALRTVIEEFNPDVVDVHEEPFSLVARQVLAVSSQLPAVMYSAQNLDKRWPPPFSRMLRHSYARVGAFYPCSRQAAAVLRRSGYRGLIRPIPLGIDPTLHHPGEQELDGPLVLGLVGRLVPEKGLLDAIDVTRALTRERPCRLLVVGSGPQEAAGRSAADGLDVRWTPWVDAEQLAALYRQMHVVLVPSRATATWVEQFGRVIPEGWANGVVPVGYASGSIPEVIADAGLVVGEGDSAALASAVRGLAADSGRMTALRENGFKRAALLRWDVVAGQLLQLYQAALAHPRPPRPRKAPRSVVLAEFGTAASTPVSSRPIALPILRTSRPLHRLLDRMSD